MSNYNFGAGYIMNSDKQTVDANIGESKLYREGLEFDTRAVTETLTEDMPKKQTKPTDTGLFGLADDNRIYAEGGK